LKVRNGVRFVFLNNKIILFFGVASDFDETSAIGSVMSNYGALSSFVMIEVSLWPDEL